MARWTKTNFEAEKVFKVTNMLASCLVQQCSIILLSGAQYDGWVKGASTGNNAAHTSGKYSIPSSWFGEINLVTTSGEVLIDFLDVDSITPKP